MSATFQLRYPSGTTTLVWAPSVNRSTGGSALMRNSGIAADVMSDGFTQYAYQIAEGHYLYVCTFDRLPEVDLLDLESFFATALGDLFDFTDGACGPVSDVRVVTLAVEGYRREWHLAPNHTFSGGFTLMDAD